MRPLINPQWQNKLLKELKSYQHGKIKRITHILYLKASIEWYSNVLQDKHIVFDAVYMGNGFVKFDIGGK